MEIHGSPPKKKLKKLLGLELTDFLFWRQLVRLHWPLFFAIKSWTTAETSEKKNRNQNRIHSNKICNRLSLYESFFICFFSANTFGPTICRYHPPVVSLQRRSFEVTRCSPMPCHKRHLILSASSISEEKGCFNRIWLRKWDFNKNSVNIYSISDFSHPFLFDLYNLKQMICKCYLVVQLQGRPWCRLVTQVCIVPNEHAYVIEIYVCIYSCLYCMHNGLLQVRNKTLK